MNSKLTYLRVIIISFITTLIVSGYKMENEADFFIFIGGIMMGIAYIFVEIIQFEESKKQ
jgi:hypothetical protein